MGDFQGQVFDSQVVGIYAGGTQTRTQIQPDGLSACWEAGDELAVWARNSSGSLVLDNQKFKTYGIDGSSGYFTSALSSAMPEDTYSYMCCYPSPVSMNGTRATFILSSQQDGKASGGADIMISDPVSHGPLRPVPELDDDHSNPSFSMNRMMHQFRFWIPSGKNMLGEDIEKIEITMPANIVGNVISDISDPHSYLQLANGTRTLTLDLADPVGESEFPDAEFACAVVFPHETPYTDSDYMNVTVYTNSTKSVLDPISLSGRSFLPGHSTPVMLLPKAPQEYCKLTMKTGMNNIGEILWNIRILSGGQTLLLYANTSGAYHNLVCEQEYFGTDGKAAYESVLNAVESGNAVLNFETNHASVDIPMTADMLERNGNSAVLNLGDVPYLLYEDFNNAGFYAINDAYSASSNSDTSVSGHSLDGYLSAPGWNAARFGILQNDCIRINCRYEAAVFAYRKYCGRLDTPTFKWIKPGVSVNVVIEYDKAIYIPAGYNMDTSGAKAKYYVGHHTGQEGKTLNGIGIGSTSDSNITSNSNIVYTSGLYASQDVGNMVQERVVIPSATNSTRAVFYVNTTETQVKVLGNNACYYLYLDNVKVYIGN